MSQSRIAPITTAIALLFALAVALHLTLQTHAQQAERAAVERKLEGARHTYDAAKARSEVVEEQATAVKTQIAALQPPPRQNSSQPISSSRLVRLKTAEIIRSNPELMAAAREATSRRFDRAYSEFFRELHLTPTQCQAIKELVAADSGIVANGYELVSPDKGGASAMKEQLEQVLGVSGYESYVRYSNSLPVREQVERLAGEMAGVEPLSATATRRLLELYSAAHAGQIDRARQNSGHFDQQAFYGEILAKAKPVLTSEQLNVLRLVASRTTGTEFITP